MADTTGAKHDQKEVFEAADAEPGVQKLHVPFQAVDRRRGSSSPTNPGAPSGALQRWIGQNFRDDPFHNVGMVRDEVYDINLTIDPVRLRFEDGPDNWSTKAVNGDLYHVPAEDNAPVESHR